MVQFKDDLVQSHTSSFHCSDQHGPEIPRLMSKPWQHWCYEKQHPAGAPQPGQCHSVPALCCGVAGNGVAWAARALSSYLAPHQPTWDFLHPWTNTEGELVVFPPGISAQRQVNRKAEAVLGILHRLQLHPVPSLDHAPNFQGPLKIQMKTNTRSTDLPERNCWLSSEQSFRKTYSSCFPFLAVLSGLIYFYPLRLITIRHGTHFLLVSHQARCSRLPLDCHCTLHASSWSFVLQQREGRPVKPCSLPVTPASSHFLH